ncbi:YoaK family protein [uncultured Streptomyces sp.]|uniref:YoaK family protein n=1 Tax=uncultured Streptomyces sp. TaxID=174707 RepID=UPI00262A0613|nr:YoaK family protein [uncultured Streptomyces sp.]
MSSALPFPSPAPAVPPSGSGAPSDLRGEWSLVMLSAASGAADAFAFLCAGRVFAGVMTGNLVLLGASAAGVGEKGVALRACLAVASYGVGAACGAWLTARWRRRLPLTLLAEVVLLTGAAGLWLLGPVAVGAYRPEVLTLVAAAMGVQARTRVTPTNYFTGTFTSLVGRRVLREPGGGERWVVARLVALVAGAAVAATAARWCPPLAAAVPVVPALVALVLETGRGRRSG